MSPIGAAVGLASSQRPGAPRGPCSVLPKWHKPPPPGARPCCPLSQVTAPHPFPHPFLSLPDCHLPSCPVKRFLGGSHRLSTRTCEITGRLTCPCTWVCPSVRGRCRAAWPMDTPVLFGGPPHRGSEEGGWLRLPTVRDIFGGPSSQTTTGEKASSPRHQSPGNHHSAFSHVSFLIFSERAWFQEGTHALCDSLL